LDYLEDLINPRDAPATTGMWSRMPSLSMD
jgi:hypothetical protein